MELLLHPDSFLSATFISAFVRMYFLLLWSIPVYYRLYCVYTDSVLWVQLFSSPRSDG